MKIKSAFIFILFAAYSQAYCFQEITYEKLLKKKIVKIEIVNFNAILADSILVGQVPVSCFTKVIKRPARISAQKSGTGYGCLGYGYFVVNNLYALHIPCGYFPNPKDSSLVVTFPSPKNNEEYLEYRFKLADKKLLNEKYHSKAVRLNKKYRILKTE
jgi:hypothetical protein